ncbi:MAG: hypothetical protein JO218_16840 [Burkholderiales bacterium]|nr:hypothetical protein [Burkholderiales bacterium]
MNRIDVRRAFYGIFLCFLTAILAACGGGASSSGTSSNATPTIKLTLNTGNQVVSGSQSTATATVLDGSGKPMANVLVTFSNDTTYATFNPASGTALTNASGVATMGVVGTAKLGADVLRASASVPGASGVTTTISTTTNYQVVAGQPGSSATLSMALTVGGASASTLTAGQDGNLSVLFVDATGNPVSGALVTFTLSSGSGSGSSALVALSSTTALTNSKGQAVVDVLGQSTTASGVVTISASAVAGSVSASNSLLFSYQPPTPNLAALTIVMPNGVTSIPQSSTVNVVASIVDANTGQPYQNALTVNFGSSCASAGTATITASAQNIAGTATATYTPQGCVGSDVITASITSLGQTRSLTKTVNIAPAAAASMQFVSATPTVLGIQGSGTGSTGSVKFQLVDASGNAVSGQAVNFALSTTAGGMVLVTQSAVTDANGYASATVQAGTIGTPLTVTATLASNTAIWAQSRGMYVSTKIPHENGFSLTATTLNPEFFAIDGNTTTLIVHASDRFGLPVPDGTVVNFRTEGGIGTIQDANNTGAPAGGCTTTQSTCSVTVTSSGNRSVLRYPGRQAIVAYAVGEDSFIDNNGDGIFDQGDTFPPPGAYLSGEPYLDVAETGSYQSGEEFIDFNNTGTYWNGISNGTYLYSGINCQYPTQCSGKSNRLVYDKLVLVWSGSHAQISIPVNSGVQYDLNGRQTLNAAYRIPAGSQTGVLYVPQCGNVVVQLVITDDNGQTMPYKTGVTIATTPSALSQGTSSSITIGNTNDTASSVTPNFTAPAIYPLTIVSGGSVSAGVCTPPATLSGSLAVTVTTPAGFVTTTNIPLAEVGPPY